MAKRSGCPRGKVPYRGRCAKLERGDCFIDNDRFFDNIYKITKIDYKQKKVSGGYLDDKGWYSTPIKEKIVKRKAFTFDEFGNKLFERC